MAHQHAIWNPPAFESPYGGPPPPGFDPNNVVPAPPDWVIRQHNLPIGDGSGIATNEQLRAMHAISSSSQVEGPRTAADPTRHAAQGGSTYPYSAYRQHSPTHASSYPRPAPSQSGPDPRQQAQSRYNSAVSSYPAPPAIYSRPQAPDAAPRVPASLSAAPPWPHEGRDAHRGLVTNGATVVSRPPHALTDENLPPQHTQPHNRHKPEPVRQSSLVKIKCEKVPLSIGPDKGPEYLTLGFGGHPGICVGEFLVNPRAKFHIREDLYPFRCNSAFMYWIFEWPGYEQEVYSLACGQSPTIATLVESLCKCVRHFVQNERSYRKPGDVAETDRKSFWQLGPDDVTLHQIWIADFGWCRGLKKFVSNIYVSPPDKYLRRRDDEATHEF